jgi:hypothetical protein
MPVQRPLLILRGFQRGLDQAPKMALPAAAPRRLDDGESIADARQGSGQDFLAASQVRRLDDAPFADPQEVIAVIILWAFIVGTIGGFLMPRISK